MALDARAADEFASQPVENNQFDREIASRPSDMLRAAAMRALP
jgi:hypothetical protein